MAVAVKNTPETTPRRPLDRLTVGSLAGVLYILGSLGIVFYGVPSLWAAAAPALAALGPFAQTALRLLAQAAVTVGLVVLGLRLAGPNPPPGLRAGIFLGLVEVVVAGLLTCWLGGLIETHVGGGPTGIALTAAIGVALLGLVVAGFLWPPYQRLLPEIESQGWFSTASYKKSQGQRVRRGTMLGILVLAGCGIYTLLAHRTLAAGPPNWEVVVPFTGGQTLILVPDVRYTVPLLLTLGTLWLALRVVNLPPFADFLIATEAELNKVSWTTRKRLVQDTIVVLVTVVLMAVFLFAVDIIWGWALSSDLVGVLPKPDAKIRTEFRALDRDGSGYLTPSDLEQTNYATFLEKIDQNGDGRITYKEFHDFRAALDSNQEEQPW